MPRPLRVSAGKSRLFNSVSLCPMDIGRPSWHNLRKCVIPAHPRRGHPVSEAPAGAAQRRCRPDRSSSCLAHGHVRPPAADLAGWCASAGLPPLCDRGSPLTTGLTCSGKSPEYPPKGSGRSMSRSTGGPRARRRGCAHRAARAAAWGTARESARPRPRFPKAIRPCADPGWSKAMPGSAR